MSILIIINYYIEYGHSVLFYKYKFRRYEQKTEQKIGGYVEILCGNKNGLTIKWNNDRIIT